MISFYLITNILWFFGVHPNLLNSIMITMVNTNIDAYIAGGYRIVILQLLVYVCIR